VEKPALPNVMVIMADQMKATASHLYGNRFCRTEALERLAGSGVLFRNAFTPHPLCMPARASLWTGRYPHSHGARRNETPLPAGSSNAFRSWRQAGDHTGLIGKNHCFAAEDCGLSAGGNQLFDTWCEIGHEGLPVGRPARGLKWCRPLEAIEAAHRVRREMPRQTAAISYATTDYPLEDYSTGLVAAQTVRFLEQRRKEPFALWVSFPDPHTPYEAPRTYFEELARAGIEVPPVEDYSMPGAPERNRVLRRILDVSGASNEHLEGLIATYHAMVRFVDDGVGKILDALERLGLREQTIVVFCSDHGDFAGEHGMTRKGGVFYDCLSRIPLLLSWPGSVPEGCVDESMVSLVDVVPTLLELQGLPIPEQVQGDPLPTVTPAAPRDAVFAEYGAGGPAFTLRDLEALPVQHGLEASKASLRWREAEGRRKMVRTRRWKYVTDPMGDVDELYDLAGDAGELVNLAAANAHAEIRAELRSRLLDWSILTEDALPVPLPELPNERNSLTP
jgi:arylsulfatase